MASTMPQAGQMIEWLFAELNGLLTDSVASTVASITSTIMPFAVIGLTINFLFYGVAIMHGKIEMPVLDFLGQALKIALISAIAANTGLYQEQIAEILVSMPDDLTAAIFRGGSPVSITQSMDKVMKNAATTTSTISNGSSYLPTTESIKNFVVALFMFGVSILFIGLSAIVLMVVKAAMALLAAVGPIFIISLLFERTKGLFDRWLGLLLNYTLLMTLFTIVFNIVVKMVLMVGNKTLEWLSGRDVNIFTILGGYVLFFFACGFVIWQLPTISTALSGGFGLQFGGPISAIRNAASSQNIQRGK